MPPAHQTRKVVRGAQPNAHEICQLLRQKHPGFGQGSAPTGASVGPLALPACPSGSQWGGNAGAGGEIPAEGLGHGGEQGRLLTVPARTQRPGDALRGTPDPRQLPVRVPGVNWAAPLAWGSRCCSPEPRKAALQSCRHQPAEAGGGHSMGAWCWGTVLGHPPAATRRHRNSRPIPVPMGLGPPASSFPRCHCHPRRPEDRGTQPRHRSAPWAGRAQRRQHGSRGRGEAPWEPAAACGIGTWMAAAVTASARARSSCTGSRAQGSRADLPPWRQAGADPAEPRRHSPLRAPGTTGGCCPRHPSLAGTRSVPEPSVPVGLTARGHGDEAMGWSGDIREQPEGTAQSLSPWEKWMMEAWREGLAWGWLHALRGLSQERVPLATGSPGVIYGCGGVLQSPSLASSILRRRVGRCR